MADEREFFVVTDEEGDEMKCEIILTFESDEFDKSYVVYQVADDDSGEYYAASFDPETEDEGRLHQIETEAEWALVEEVLESFFDDDESDEENN